MGFCYKRNTVRLTIALTMLFFFKERKKQREELFKLFCFACFVFFSSRPEKPGARALSCLLVLSV